MVAGGIGLSDLDPFPQDGKIHEERLGEILGALRAERGTAAALTPR
jgi:hypothetical protein